MKRILALSLMFMFLLGMTACAQTLQETPAAESTVPAPEGENDSTTENLGHFNLETATVTLNSSYEMPIMGLGTYSLSDEECYNSVTALLGAGERLIDTAYMYHNEAAVGRTIRDSDVPREEIFVITKLYPSQFDDPEAAIQLALDTLDIGYIDMMLLHHPGDGVERDSSLLSGTGCGAVYPGAGYHGAGLVSFRRTGSYPGTAGR